MKIISFSDSLKQESIKIFKPVQYIYLSVVNYKMDTANIRARIINTTTGKTEEIIPNISVLKLAEIASRNEGFFVKKIGTTTVSGAVLPTAVDLKGEYCIMLHPSMSVGLSNDRYMEIDILDLQKPTPTSGSYTATMDVYGLENHKIDNDFAMKYRKFYMAAGELQKSFTVGDNEDLILPNDNTLSEVQLYYARGGYAPVYMFPELCMMQRMKNDVCCVDVLNDLGVASTSVTNGFVNIVDVDVEGVDTINVKRASGASSYEFFMLDMSADTASK
ncbi:hypothetical protein [uncultured Bacteroides sp.]|uniref:hypothetical protein n=1 Tax=uncultured Bacteroides sp. TaxID=162156 RepID=UPI002AA83A04|nr:hypothetical protein [uncultured Bacteroides sp.]